MKLLHVDQATTIPTLARRLLPTVFYVRPENTALALLQMHMVDVTELMVIAQLVITVLQEVLCQTNTHLLLALILWLELQALHCAWLEPIILYTTNQFAHPAQLVSIAKVQECRSQLFAQ